MIVLLSIFGGKLQPHHGRADEVTIIMTITIVVAIIISIMRILLIDSSKRNKYRQLCRLLQYPQKDKRPHLQNAPHFDGVSV